ncbi:hypothetical protein [Brenneria corticis]|uniref:hypothetical protein n=1 Tax=Brenneria corticis TaxID=2173106 RepID=UPI00109E2BC6|nr:hypothetical protein [Brenneria sp. CFCC 11842]
MSRVWDKASALRIARQMLKNGMPPQQVQQVQQMQQMQRVQQMTDLSDNDMQTVMSAADE